MAGERKAGRLVRRTLLAIGVLLVLSSAFWVGRNTLASLNGELATTRRLIGSVREEKETALDLVGAREREIDKLRAKLARSEGLLDERGREAREAREAQEAATERAREDREEDQRLKREVEARCNEAMGEKNDAIAALVAERESKKRAACGVDEQVAKRDEEIAALKREVEAKEGEIARMREEHKEAHRESLQRESHASNIWNAAVAQADAGTACEAPLPTLSEASQIGDFLQNEKRRVGVELGFQVS